MTETAQEIFAEMEEALHISPADFIADAEPYKVPMLARIAAVPVAIGALLGCAIVFLTVLPCAWAWETLKGKGK